MTEVEKVHFLTEAIHKNLLDNFSPGVKQLLSTGRAFQKALHSVVNSSKAYVDCIYGLARSAQVCKGATSEIGAALLQIAEVHKEINTQVLDNIKTFHSELLIPLESAHESDLKQMQLVHKKYLAGHKYHLSPYEKAQLALKKQKKKNKNKFGFDQKELQYSREVKECLLKLEEYHSGKLREALLEERKRYCGLLEKICTVVRNYASHHSKAHELLTHRLTEWSEMSQNPHILPESSELVIQAFRNAHQDNTYSTTDEIQEMRRRTSLEEAQQGSNSGSVPGSNQDSDSLTYGTSHRLPSDPFHSSMSNGVLTTQDDYAVAGLQRSLTFHDSPSSQGRRRVQAVYSHDSEGADQLSFNEGDVINLLGDARDGWQYGESMRTHRMGWFPVSFTQPLQTGSADAQVSVIPPVGISSRVKSLGNLREVSDEDYHHQHQMAAVPQLGGPAYSDSDSGHGGDLGKSQSSSRPHSLYYGQDNLTTQSNKTPQHRSRLDKRVSWCEGWFDQPQRTRSMFPLSSPVPLTTPHTDPVQLLLAGAPLRLPRLGVRSCLRRITEYGGNGSPLTSVQQMQLHRDSPSPPLPPPPPPPLVHQHESSSHSVTTNRISPSMPPPPPPFTLSSANTGPNIRPNHPPFLHSMTSPTLNSPQNPPPPPMYQFHPNHVKQFPKPDYMPPSQLRAMTTSQNSAHSPASSGYSSNSSGYHGHTMRSSQGDSGMRNNNSGSRGYAGSNDNNRERSSNGFPPPPPNMPPPPPVENQSKNPFTNVPLKKTTTNDRSAPRIQ